MRPRPAPRSCSDRAGCTPLELAANTIHSTGVDLMAAVSGVLRADSPSQRATHEATLAAATSLLIPDSLAARLEAWSSIVVVGLDSFGYVPFEALTWREARIGTEKSVSYLPSLPVGLWLRERLEERGARSTDVLFYGGTGAVGAELESIGSLPSLALDRGELEALAAFYPGRATVRLAGPSELDILDDALLQSGGIVNLIVHGVYRAALERPAGLLVEPALGWDGVLFADAIEARGIGPDLAILTACGAGKSRLRRGDDGRGQLAGAFFQAGSLAVVQSYTDLALEASLDLLGHCHEQVASGASVEEALTHARREARPEQHGVHAIHSSLVHVLGLGELTFFPRAREVEPAPEPSVPADSFPWIGTGAAMAAVLSIVVALVARRSRAS